MLTKLWCWLFGHNYYRSVFTGKYGRVFHIVIADYVEVPVNTRVEVTRCVCCGEENPRVYDPNWEVSPAWGQDDTVSPRGEGKP